MGTPWDMPASRKILLKHFDARAAEYRDEMVHAGAMNDKSNLEPADKPVSISFLLDNLSQNKRTSLKPGSFIG